MGEVSHISHRINLSHHHIVSKLTSTHTQRSRLYSSFTSSISNSYSLSAFQSLNIFSYTPVSIKTLWLMTLGPFLLQLLDMELKR